MVEWNGDWGARVRRNGDWRARVGWNRDGGGGAWSRTTQYRLIIILYKLGISSPWSIFSQWRLNVCGYMIY